MLSPGQATWPRGGRQIEEIGERRPSIPSREPRVSPADAERGGSHGLLQGYSEEPPPAALPSAARSSPDCGGSAPRAMVEQEAHEFMALTAPPPPKLRRQH